MSTTHSFQSMLNDYMPNDLLRDEFLKRDYLLSKVEKKNDWKGGPLIVPFQGAYASSVSLGSLTASNDISEDVYVRGEISTYPEIWGSMVFNHKDILEQNGKVNEQSFLKLLPDAIESFMDKLKWYTSQQIMTGAIYAKVIDASGNGGVANPTALGLVSVDRVERFSIGQKVQLDDDNSAPGTYYVILVNLNTDTLSLSATRGGAVADLTAYTIAQNAVLYLDNGQLNSFTSLKSSLLSAANGGSTNLYGVAKTAYPSLQALNFDGSTITSANLVSKLFTFFNTSRQKGKGNPSTAMMSFKHLGTVMALVEASKGAFKVAPDSVAANLYGWTSVIIHGVYGALEVVGIQEMPDDNIMFVDWRALSFHSNGFFQKRTAPDGKQYFESRATTGYTYIIDISLFGDLVVKRPNYCSIVYGISYA